MEHVFLGMIYISSCCSKNDDIIESIEFIAKNGFKNIELTGGSLYQDDLTKKLLALKDKYHLSYLLHNYFPPPKNNFIINSADKFTINDLKIFLKNSIELSKILKAKFYAIHAGFLIKIINFNSISNHDFVNNEKSRRNGYKIMSNIYDYLNDISKGEVKIYFENNVLSKKNYLNFNNKNPFLLCCLDDYIEMYDYFKFNILLDLAHLKVSCATLNKDFKTEALTLIDKTNYLHISGNNNYEDSCFSIKNDPEIISLLNESDFSNKTITLEVYSGIKDVKESYNLISNN